MYSFPNPQKISTKIHNITDYMAAAGLTRAAPGITVVYLLLKLYSGFKAVCW